MSDKMREMFEARFTVPPGVYWNDDRQRYATHYHESLRMAERQRDLWKAWQAAHAAALAELDAKDARIRELEGALQGLLNIVNDSYGVDGYHLNGDVAHWSSFDEVAIAEAAIAKEKGNDQVV